MSIEEIYTKKIKYKQAEENINKREMVTSGSKWRKVEASGGKWKQVEGSCKECRNGGKWKQVEENESK